MAVKINTNDDGVTTITPSGDAEYCNFFVTASKEGVSVELAYVDSTEGAREMLEALTLALEIYASYASEQQSHDAE